MLTQYALSDIRILDFTQNIAGPYCTKLLADYGAEVIKVERPGVGDGARRIGPFPKDTPHPEKSGTFLHLNTNKRSITLDLTTDEGRQTALDLAARADAVVESFRPGTMDSFALGYDALSEVNPKLVMTSISNFGQTGPYRDWRGSEIIFYGMGGELYSTGVSEKEPLKLGGTVGLYQAGTVAAYSTLGAIFAARDQANGQRVDVSIMETQAGSIDRRMSMLLAYQYNGEITKRTPLGAASGGGWLPIGSVPLRERFLPVHGRRQLFPSRAGYARIPGGNLGRRVAYSRIPGRRGYARAVRGRVLPLAYGSNQERNLGTGSEFACSQRAAEHYGRPSQR